jgi:predicted ATPase/DNA-binding XRE family transcriptional regulator/Tfp pilus assembly protein PilF
VIEQETTFGAWLKQRRKELDMTQFDLAECVGCSEGTIQKIEAGARKPSRQVAQLLAQCLGITSTDHQAFVSLARGQGPPAASRLSAPTNLPAQISALIGRHETVAEVRARLLQDAVRLLTLTGPPGIGKTRLGLAVGTSLLDDFQDGVFFVALAPVGDPGLVAASIAQVLGIKEARGQALFSSIAAYLREMKLLLVLDNFEQVLDASPVVVELLGTCPSLKVLVTSREALHVNGEQQFPVPALPTPDPTHLPPLDALPGYPAVALFLERAQAVKPEFKLTEENALEVAAICARLDGLPLPIELAAARVNLLSPRELMARLEKSLELLATGARHMPPRQQTLQAAIGWSYNLLDEGEQALFPRLGVFVGGCTLSAIEAVCDAPAGNVPALQIDLLRGVASLVDKSLLRQEEGVEGESRYTMLETIRGYALELLNESGQAETLRRLHAEYFTTLAEAAEVEYAGPKQGMWWARLDIEHDNLRAALRWCHVADTGDTTTLGLRLASALGLFWEVHGYLKEGREHLSAVLSQAREKMPGLAQPPTHLFARALTADARLALRQGDYDESRRGFEEGLAIWRELEDKGGMALALNGVANAVAEQGNYTEASALFEEALALRRELNDELGIPWILDNLGLMACMQGNYDRAEELLEEALALHRESNQKMGVANSLYFLGQVAQTKGCYDNAQALLKDSLVLIDELGYKPEMALILERLAQIAFRQNSPDRAARLFGLEEALCRSIGFRITGDLPQYNLDVQSIRAALGEVGFAKAWEEGQRMTIRQGIAYALDPG